MNNQTETMEDFKESKQRKCKVEKRRRNCFIREVHDNFTPEQVLQNKKNINQNHQEHKKSKKRVNETGN